MSEADKEISEVGGTVDDADDDDQEVVGGGSVGGGGGGVHVNNDGKKQGGCGYGFACKKNFRKAKQVVLFPLTTATKQLCNRTKRQSQNRRLSSAASVNACLSGKSFDGTSSKGCCFCFTQPRTLDSAVESHRSDPNDPVFSYEMLKSLIESNDFYSNECNPHLDFHDHQLQNATG